MIVGWARTASTTDVDGLVALSVDAGAVPGVNQESITVLALTCNGRSAWIA
ncbi:MAG: hypothetical protein U0359_07525 [Byssovorax sp.]